MGAFVEGARLVGQASGNHARRQANFCRFTKSGAAASSNRCTPAAPPAASWIVGRLADDDLHLPMREAGDRNPLRRRGPADSLTVSPGGVRRRDNHEKDKPEARGQIRQAPTGIRRPHSGSSQLRGGLAFELLAAKAWNRLQWRDRAGFSPASASQRCKLSIRAARALSIRRGVRTEAPISIARVATLI